MKRGAHELFESFADMSLTSPRASKRQCTEIVVSKPSVVSCADPFNIGPIVLDKVAYTQDEVRDIIESRECRLHTLFRSFVSRFGARMNIRVPNWIVGF